MLGQIAIFLAAAVVAVPLSRRFGLGAVLGYLAAGILIGPWALQLIDDVEAILHFSEFGVVLLLFIIGLELQPSRLWVLRRQVFGLGSAQVTLTALALGTLALAAGLSWQGALVIGVGLAMSSTAFALQTLAERKQLTTRHGRESFAILLFQDLAVIPLLAALPFLAPAAGAGESAGWLDALRAVGIVTALVVSSRVVVRPLFRVIATFGGREIFTAMSLFIVVGVTMLMEFAGLTASLGAFLAGMLLADSEYRHELEANIEPFKGLLLGLFFISVGMSANLGVILEEPLLVAAIVLGVIAIKFAALVAIARAAGTQAASARKLGIALAQGGEFAFVLFAAAATAGILATEVSQLLVVAVTLTMLAAPLLFLLEDTLLAPWLDRGAEPEFDSIEPNAGHVVIAGYGRVAQIVARVLAHRRIAFVALEKDAGQVDTVRKFGGKLYFGDATRLELLHAANTGEARLLVLAIDEPEDSLKCATLVRHHFPRLPILARARNRRHAHRLMDLGITRIYRETWHTSMEMAEQTLLQMGVAPSEASLAMAGFRAHDLELLGRQHAIYQDEARLAQSSREASEELLSLFESDREQASASTPLVGKD